MLLNTQLQKLWEKYISSSFPKGYGGEEIDGIDLALLDTEIAGCIHTFINSGGQLDSLRIQILKDCLGDLIVVTQKLDGGALDYFTQLKTLSHLILQEIESTAKND